MITILMIFIIIVSILLMFVVLIQSSKGGGLAGTFGGGDASMVFGVRRTADFLIKLTTVLGTIFLLFSLITNIIINKGIGERQSIIQGNQQTFPQQNVPNSNQFEGQQPGNQQQQPPVEQQQQQQQQPPSEPPK